MADLPTNFAQWRVRRTHLTSAAGAAVVGMLSIPREIGVLASGKVTTVRAPPGKVLATILYPGSNFRADIVLFWPTDFEPRVRKKLERLNRQVGSGEKG